MSDPGNGARPGRQAWAALAFALAALAAAWHPVSAPIGLLVGLASGGLALAALRRPERRPLALAALLASLAALGLALLVLSRTAGLVRPGEGEGGPALVQPSPAETRAALDAAAATTQGSRARAAQALDGLAKPKPSN